MRKRLAITLTDDGEWHLPRAARQKQADDVTRAQVLAMALGARLSAFLWKPARMGEITARIDRLRGDLSKHQRERLQGFGRRVAVVAPGQKDYAARVDVGEHIEQMLKAMIECQTVSLSYKSHHRALAGQSGRRLLVHPLGIVFYKDGVYFVVDVAASSAELAGERRLLSVDRMSALVAGQAGGFHMPADFDAGAFFADALGIFPQGSAREVVVEVDAGHAPWVLERTFHPSQRIEERTDGSLLVRLTVASEVDVIDWVLSMGEHAELVEPADLRARLASRLVAASSRYREGGDISCPGPPYRLSHPDERVEEKDT